MKLKVPGYFLDWRNILTLVAAVVLALVTFVVIDSAMGMRESRKLALAAARASQLEAQRGIDSRQASSAQIDQLQHYIAVLSEQSLALSEQIRQLGGRPVVVITPTPPVPPPTTVPPTTTTTTTTTTVPTTATTKKPRTSTTSVLKF